MNRPAKLSEPHSALTAPGDATVVAPADAARRVVVVGGGPVGVRAAQELSRRGAHVALLNAERWRPYNRVKLTPLLAGETQIGLVYLSEHFPRPGRVDRYDGVSVVDIDRDEQEALTSTGRVFPYDQLVLALGSRAFVPQIPGADLDGVFTFRDFNDAEALISRSFSARRAVVIGGGLLGLEAARGMARRGAEVTVVEHEDRLMPRQLDSDAGARLSRRIEALGTRVLTGVRVAELEGDARVEAVALASGERLAADTVIVCTGVRANTQLAAGVGLKHRRGIIVDDQLRTSDPDIFAIGECAEHNELVYGLVGPGYDQALTAAAVIMGEEGRYEGSLPATKLKVLGAEVFSMGDFESVAQQPGVRSYVWENIELGAYRRIFVRRGRLAAALGVGDWPEATRLQQALARGQSVTPLNTWSFGRTGRLWRESDDDVSTWRADAIVCNCTGVTKGAIANAVTLGAASLDEVRLATSANTVCGSCKPLVQELLGQGAAAPEPVRWWRALLWLSGVAAALALASALLPRIPMADTFVVGDIWFKLWFDGLWKQWSGYVLLGITIAAALIGLRKRVRFLARLGGYDWWRIVHLCVGAAAAIALAVHTGFRLGSNLNMALMISFLATLAFGAVAGLATGGEHALREKGLGDAKRPPRRMPLWIHIVALWPLPALLVIHILSVYTY